MLISYPMLPEKTPRQGPSFQEDKSYKSAELPKADRSGLRDEPTPGNSVDDESFGFDRELIDQADPVSVPATSLDNLAQVALQQQATHGTYPISHDRRWHAGIHLSATTTNEPIRAIADGVVVAARHTSKPIPYKTGSACNNGFVLLKHTTEIGARRIPGSAGKIASVSPITFTYFSLYMHLADQEMCDASGINRVTDLTRPLRRLKPDCLDTYANPNTAPRVYRREILGWAGKMYGEGLCHHEVFTTEAELKKVFPDTAKLVAQKTSSDRLPWGKLYFYIPSGTALLASPTRAEHGFISKDDSSIKPEIESKKETEEKKVTDKKGHTVTKTVTVTKKVETGRYYDSAERRSVFFPDGKAGTCATALVVEMWYHEGSRYFRMLKPVDPSESRWEPINGHAFRMANYEYDLFLRALRMYSDSQSAGMDLMRFGRVIGVDEPKSDQSDAWLAIPYADNPSVRGYVDLASSKVLKFSDADFPHFSGWKYVQDSVDDAWCRW